MINLKDKTLKTLRNVMRKNVDVGIIPDVTLYTKGQLNEIYYGCYLGVDVTEYMDPSIDDSDMLFIRSKLTGKDLDLL